MEKESSRTNKIWKIRNCNTFTTQWTLRDFCPLDGVNKDDSLDRRGVVMAFQVINVCAIAQTSKTVLILLDYAFPIYALFHIKYRGGGRC